METESAVGQEGALRDNSISVTGLTAEAIGANGPETNAAATTAVIFLFSAAATPFLFLLALIPGICYASTISRFARTLVSAGGTYQFIKSALGERAGLAGGWIYFMGIFLFVGGAAALAGYLFDLLGSAIFGDGSWFAHGHWFEMALVVLLVCGWLSWRGISISVSLLLALSSIGMGSILILDLVMLVSTRNTGFTLSGLLPWNTSVSFQNLAVGFGLAMGCFFGCEAAAFLGEEAHAPKKTVPRAVNISAVVLLLFCFINALAISKGVGQDNLGEVGEQGAGMLQTLGASYIAHWYGDILLLVVGIGAVTSTLGLLNVVSRLIFDFGREGSFHPRFGETHPTNRTPHNAIFLLTAIAIVVCVAGLVWQGDGISGGTVVYGWILLAGVLLLLVAYVLISLGAIVLSARTPTRTVALFVAPVIVVVTMCVSIFSQIHPFPPAPYSYAPLAAIIWCVGCGVYAALRGRRPASGDRVRASGNLTGSASPLGDGRVASRETTPE